MIQFIKGFIVIAFGIILILAGVFNWKRILFISSKAEVLVKYTGLTVYRIIIILFGVLWLIWLTVGLMGW